MYCNGDVPNSVPEKAIGDQILDLINVEPDRKGPKINTRDELVCFYRPFLVALGLSDVAESSSQSFGRSLERTLAKRVIHVAGTKGKGSTCAFIESIARASGYRTGLYTSPHLVAVNERIRLNGKPVSDCLLKKHFERLINVLRSFGEEKRPNFFGCLTLLAFSIFAEANLDVAIIEVGLGGRLDATNVLEKPFATAVALIDKDHVEILGDTLEAIAKEKAGIFKDGVPVFIGSGQDEAALSTLMSQAAKAHTGTVHVACPCPPDSPPKLGIGGEHQRINAGLAASICRLLAEDGYNISNEHIDKGLSSCSWPGRGQIVDLHEKGSLYLDGAHTPKSMQCAVRWFEQACGIHADNKETILLFYCTHTRDPFVLFEYLLASSVRFSKVLFAPNIRGKPSRIPVPTFEEIMKGRMVNTFPSSQTICSDSGTWVSTVGQIWRQMSSIGTNTNDGQQVFTFSSLQDALDYLGLSKNSMGLKNGHTSESRTDSRRIFVTGSLLLVGDVLKLIDGQIRNC